MKKLAVLVCFVLASSSTARAQIEPGVHLVWHTEAGRSGETWAQHVQRRLEGEELEVHRDDAWATARGADQREAYAALVRVEAALGAARAAMREFDEHAALTLLAGAREDAVRSLPLAGAVAWAAEVELAIGRVAAQAGQRDLARASFARAFAVAPTRALGAAEAAPEVVALAAEVMTQVRAEAPARFDVAVSWDEPALVFLDDQPLGRAPRRVETRAGAHVIRVEAEGAEPYAAWIDVLPGSRPPLAITLSPTALVGALRSARAALARGELVGLPAHVASIDAALGEPVVIWIVEGPGGPLDTRAIATGCDRDACHGPVRLDSGSRESPLGALDAPATSASARRAALAWRDEPLPVEVVVPPSDPWTEPWPWALVGTGAALVLGGVIAGVVVATEPPPDRQLVVVPTFTP